MFVNSIAQFVDFEFFVVVVSVVVVIAVVVVIVVVFVNLLARKTFTRFNNRFGGKRQLNTVVLVSVNTACGTGRASLVVKDSKVDGLSVLLGTVRTDEILSVPVQRRE